METISFSAFHAKVVAEVWSGNEPENLLGTIRQYAIDGLIDLQRNVECLKDIHTDVITWSATLFKCGVTVFDAPRGIIRKVTLVANAEYCDPIRYHQRNIDTLNCWSRRFMCLVTAPPNLNMEVLPLGAKFPESSTDSPYGRALRGLWAIDGTKLYVAPWIQSNESVVVEWTGLKRKYADTDLLPDDDDLRRAVRLWVQKEYYREQEVDANAARMAEIEYREARSELMLECREERRTRQDVTCQAELDAVSLFRGEVITPDVAEDEVTVFAVVGDGGLAGTPQSDVAALMKSWNPEWIHLNGDVNYESGDPSTMDANAGIYRKFIFPFKGAYPLQAGEVDATENQCFVSLGNHDLDYAVGQAGQAVFDYFPLPSANRRYYDFASGHVHVFVLNSGFNSLGVNTEPDGVDAFSIQCEWLLLRVAQSTAKWKVAIFHHCPYTSDITHYPGQVELRWPFPQMNLDLCIESHGHNYERLLIDNFPHLVVGTGGHSLREFHDPPVTGSLVRYSADYGALRVEASCSHLKCEFVTRTGIVVDTMTLI